MICKGCGVSTFGYRCGRCSGELRAITRRVTIPEATKMKTRSEARAEKAKGKPDAEAEAYAKAEREAIQAEEPRAAAEVERLSGELKSALGEKPEPEKPAGSPFRWPNANKAKEHGLREDLVRVVETVFLDDIHAEWKSLEAALTLGEKRSEHAHAIAALDKAAERADRAFRLYLTAKLAREKWEAENEPVWAAMWSEATRSLQSEKDSGTRSKQITDADVKARVATLYPDEYKAQEERRRSVELTVRSLERLADIWFSKMRNLDSHVAKLRG